MQETARCEGRIGICTLPSEGASEAARICLGDSGSTAGTVREGNFEVNGVVAAGDEKCEFGILTEVFDFVSWIEEGLDGGTWE